MTAPRPVTHARLAALLTARGIAHDEQLLTEIVEACKRQSSAPEAVRIYQEYAEQTPPKAFWESMEQNVKDLVLWEQIVSAYVALGWNKGNLANMFEYYLKGSIPRANTPASKSPQPKSLSAVIDFMTEIGMVTNG